jgi:hypothetical protein
MGLPLDFCLVSRSALCGVARPETSRRRRFSVCRELATHPDRVIIIEQDPQMIVMEDDVRPARVRPASGILWAWWGILALPLVAENQRGVSTLSKRRAVGEFAVWLHDRGAHKAHVHPHAQERLKKFGSLLETDYI